MSIDRLELESSPRALPQSRCQHKVMNMSSVIFMNQVQARIMPVSEPQAITVPRLLAWFLPSNLRANVAQARSVPSVNAHARSVPSVVENGSHLYLAWFLPSKKRANGEIYLREGGADI